MQAEKSVELPGLSVGTDETKFRAKARAFLRAHLDHVAIHKLRMNRPLTTTDLGELERILVESGVGGPGDIRRAAQQARGLGLFVRSLIGMDREAAKSALAEFLTDGTLSSDQIEFVNMIVDHLTEHGVMSAARLYESPFTDVAARGPEALFDPPRLDRLVATLHAIEATASAA
jgi:type I restriction enzyme R subunit